MIPVRFDREDRPRRRPLSPLFFISLRGEGRIGNVAENNIVVAPRLLPRYEGDNQI